MFVKKTISMLMLTATISMTVAVPGYAAMKITDANSFKWSQTGSEWKVVDGSGKPATGFISYNDQTYFLDKNGIMKTGWIKSSGSWYYLNDNGTLAVDQWIDNYYVDSTGKMTKIQQDKDKEALI